MNSIAKMKIEDFLNESFAALGWVPKSLDRVSVSIELVVSNAFSNGAHAMH
jgi:hypothetical protein